MVMSDEEQQDVREILGFPPIAISCVENAPSNQIVRKEMTVCAVVTTHSERKLA